MNTIMCKKVKKIQINSNSVRNTPYIRALDVN